jgi:hypothetical protein
MTMDRDLDHRHGDGHGRTGSLPLRFWLEAAAATLGTVLFGLTLVTREWFEALTGVDPDGGSGALEVVIAVGLLAVAVVSALGARRTLQRATAGR